MQILFNDKKEITSFVTIGSLENGFQINDELLPLGFKENFEPLKYKLEDGKIIDNSEFKTTVEVSKPLPNTTTHDEELWEMVANLQVQSVQSNMIAQQALQKVEELENRGVSNDQS